MAASLSLRVYTGAGAGTQSDPVSAIDMISADNAVSSQANRNANPINVGTRSFEKWLKLGVEDPPANSLTNFTIYGDGATQDETALYWGTAEAGATPTDEPSTVATNDFTACQIGSQCMWDPGPIVSTGDTTRFLVLQLEVSPDAGPGDWEEETVNYSFDEQ